MKPFLILQLRAHDKAADDEFEAILRFGGLAKDEVRRIRIEKEGVPTVDLDDYSAVIMGGGPSNVSDAVAKKSPEQKRFESDLEPLLDQVLEKDFPFLGACYGIGALTAHLGGSVSKEKYSEEVGPVQVHLTEAAAEDDLINTLPKEFTAFVGHKEACQEVPEGAVLLASSDTCPVQMIRIGQNVYGTQFHPELDVQGIIVRVNTYKYDGYFPPEDAEKVIDNCRDCVVTEPPKILKNFVEKYRQ